MTIGEKIKALRSERGFTQEMLAEKMNVSRSAIAKWESDTGVPDIDNLKMIKHILNISMDELLDGRRISEEVAVEEECNFQECYEYKDYLCDIELDGWNDGVNNVFIIGEDEDLIYYQRNEKNGCVYGLIGKACIASVKKTRICENLFHNNEFNGREYFCKKHVCVELIKTGFVNGFFDFRDDDYMDVIVESFSKTNLCIKFGKKFDVKDLSKIEELKL